MTLSWSIEEKEFVRTQYKNMSYREIASALQERFGIPRTREAVKLQVALMGLNNPRGCISDHTRDEEAMLRWRKLL